MLNNFIDSWVRAGAVAEIVGAVAILLFAAVMFIRYKWQDWQADRKRAKTDREYCERMMREFDRSREDHNNEK